MPKLRKTCSELISTLKTNVYPICAVTCTFLVAYAAIPLGNGFRAFNTCISYMARLNNQVYSGSGPLALSSEDERNYGMSRMNIAVANAVSTCLNNND